MEKVGVEAIVEGIGLFQKNMGKMNKALDLFALKADQSSKGPGILSKVLGNLGDSFRRVRDIVTAMIIRDIFGAITRQIGNMIKGAVDAGIEFQNLSVRLETMLGRDFIKDGIDPDSAFKKASGDAAELFDWIQKLAITTPIDTKEIANVFTLAKSYNFTTDMAKDATVAITNFAAGMGLSGVEMERIIQNFGQMIQQGKITGTELRDLARGAYVPTNDILKEMQKTMQKNGAIDFAKDISKLSDKSKEYSDDLKVMLQRQSEFTDNTKESTKMALAERIDDLRSKIKETNAEMTNLQGIQSGEIELTSDIFKDMVKEGASAELFIQSFIDVMDRDMGDAAKRASSTLSGAFSNVTDLTQNLLGLKVLKPVFDELGTGISGFLNALVEGDKFDKMNDAAFSIGQNIAALVQTFFALLPPADEIADKIIEGLQGIATWLQLHQLDIVNFFRNSFAWIRDVGLPRLREFVGWIRENWPLVVVEFRKASEFIKTVLVPAFLKISKWVSDNREQILSFLIAYGKALITWNIIKQVVIWVASLILKIFALIQIVKSVIFIVKFFFPIIKGFGLLLAGAALPVVALGTALVLLGLIISRWGKQAFQTFTQIVFLVTRSFLNMVNKVREFGSRVLSINWGGIGGAIVRGIAGGILGGAGSLVSAAVTAAQWAFNAAKNWLGIRSPSLKFAAIGMDSMAGFAKGILDSVKLPEQASQFAAQSAVQSASQAIPSISNVTSSTTTVTNNYNQNIQSNAQVEPIINDFRALESAAQGA